MSADTLTAAGLTDIPRGSHVCWVVSDEETYVPIASTILARANETREKAYAFGPAGAATQRALKASGAIVMDPFVDILGGRSLEPATMFAAFRDETERARSEGYSGVRVVADMDWLLPAGPSPEQTANFELLLDNVVHSLDATVVCMYRERSFDRDTVAPIAAVHPLVCGADTMYRLTAGSDAWMLSGEIDVSVLDAFENALVTLLRDGPITLDLHGLRFIDCAGMRAFARVMNDEPGLRVRSIPASMERIWALAGFAENTPLAPTS